MTQEDKNLLLKDLCARLPYGVRMKELDPVNGIELEFYLTSIYKDIVQVNTNGGGIMAAVIDAFKPYLRPWSSMTEEEKKEERELWDIVTKTRNDLHYLYTDFLLTHHLDYRGLIEKGLALEAPEGMYKFD